MTGTALGVLLLWPLSALAETTLRVVPQAGLTSLDPVFAMADVTTSHGYMVYDTLFALDAMLRPQPQMVETYQSSADGQVWTFTLRDGLRFHDGSPVESTDVVASIRRWAARITAGQIMTAFAERIVTTDARSFEIRFERPFGAVLAALAAPDNPLFVQRAEEARTDPDTPITAAIGSGPFRFVAEAWQPGKQAVYLKNQDYVARDEPASGLAGGKRVAVDRVEWLHLPAGESAAQALIDGEVDLLALSRGEVLPLLEDSPGVTLRVIDRLGRQAILRPNHLVPPFDHPAARRALLYLAGDQSAYLGALTGRPERALPCWAVLVCGTPLATTAGIGAWALGDREANLAKARALFAEASYDGEPVVLLDPGDGHPAHPQVLVTAQGLRDAGVEVDVQTVGSDAMLARRRIKDPPAAGTGGWNLFHGWAGGVALSSLLTNLPLPTPCDQSNWFGWPCDEELENLRRQFFTAATPAEQKATVDRLQARFYEVVPYVPLGQFVAPLAYRNDITGVLDAVRLVLWNIEKR